MADTTLKKNKPNYIYAIMSMALVLFLLGFFGLFLLHTPKWVKAFKEEMVVTIEFKNDVSKPDIHKVMENLETLPFVKPSSVEFIGKEDAAEEMKEELGEDWLSLDIANPFYDMVNFNLKSNYLNVDSFDVVRNRIKEDIAVSDVFYQSDNAEQINSNLRRIGWTSFLLGLLFVVIAISLIHSTIKLAMYSDRFLIKNMQLVGASWDFISRPYVVRGIKNGLWSAFIAIALLGIIMMMLDQQFPNLKLNIWVQDFLSLFIVIASLIFLGVMISGFSTYIVVEKYLKKKLDDLY